jgi:hypothetical protein
MAIVGLSLTLSGCTSQFTLGPAAWGAAAAPVIPGFTAVPLPGGGFIEEPNSMFQPSTTPSEPPPSPIETVITGLEQAQKVRTLTRQLAR